MHLLFFFSPPLVTWDSPCTKDLNFPSLTPSRWLGTSLPWRPVTWPSCLSNILLLLLQPLQTQGGGCGGVKIPLPAISFFRQPFPLEKHDPTSFGVLWNWFGFPGEKMHLFVWGFLSDNPSIVVHLPVFFFPSPIWLRWVLCHFQRRRLLCVRGRSSSRALGCSPGAEPPAAQQSPPLLAGATCSPAVSLLKKTTASVVLTCSPAWG